MTTIESNKELINATDEVVFSFLGNLNNFSELVPEQVENWKSDQDSCSFRVSGMADIGLRIMERVPHQKIVVSSDGKSPVNFTMLLNILKEDEVSCNFQIVFLADLNSFMAMMATKPLTNFVNVLAQKLRAYYEKK